VPGIIIIFECYHTDSMTCMLLFINKKALPAYGATGRADHRKVSNEWKRLRGSH
jgi:hypothetical protein